MFFRATKYGKEGLALARTWVLEGSTDSSKLPPLRRLWPVFSIPSLGDQEVEPNIIDVPIGVLTGQRVSGKDDTGAALMMLRQKRKVEPDGAETLDFTGIALIVLADPDIAAIVLGELYLAKKNLR